MIHTHKRTGQRLLFIRGNNLVSSLYVLDKHDKKIVETNGKGRVLLDIYGNTRYKIAICLTDNLM